MSFALVSGSQTFFVSGALMFSKKFMEPRKSGIYIQDNNN
jgi:hypothetical protein